MLQKFVDIFIFNVLHFSRESIISKILNFFIYDTIKIFCLLFIMISIIGFLRTYLSEEKIKSWINNKKFLSYFSASIFGAITPFCSCSSIPFFFSFLKMGIPLGVAFSFLITSPIVNEYLVVLMIGFFGFKITIVYVFSGIIIGVISGYILGKINLEKYVSKDFRQQCSCKEKQNDRIQLYNNFKERINFGIKEAIVIIKKLWKWILLGVGIGSFIHNYVPKELIESLVNSTGFFSIPLATILGVPMYGSCASIVPIAIALFKKGVPLATALVFMMATSSLSLPEAILLRKAMKLKLVLLFFTITTLSIMIVGYIMNFFFV